MPDRRAVNALSIARDTQRETLHAELSRAGYDARTLDELPEPGECGCALATAIRRWHTINAELAAAEARPYGWSN